MNHRIPETALVAAAAERADPTAAAPVHVAGIGYLTPLGRHPADFDAALFHGHSALRAHHVALPGLDPMDLALATCHFDSQAARSRSRLPLDRGTAMALAAALDAAAQSDIDLESVDADRIGVFWGSGMAGAVTFDQNTQALYAQQRRMRPTTVLTVMPNAAVAELALHFGARGSALGYACACASSAVAIGEAMRAIRGGWIDVAIAGGHECLLTPGLLAGWHAMHVMAPANGQPNRACRPFSADRAGFALGEGAAALLLESEAHARARGACRDARAADEALSLVGYANNCDGSHITQPDPTGQARAMRAALRDAGLQATQIGYLNAHGTATLAGDRAEASAIHAVFGNGVPVSATKAIHGHLLGGGAVEMVATLRALAQRRLPPTAHLETPDPDFDLDLVRGSSRAAPQLRYAMSNSFAFGGTNAVLVARRGLAA